MHICYHGNRHAYGHNKFPGLLRELWRDTRMMVKKQVPGHYIRIDFSVKHHVNHLIPFPIPSTLYLCWKGFVRIQRTDPGSIPAIDLLFYFAYCFLEWRKDYYFLNLLPQKCTAMEIRGYSDKGDGAISQGGPSGGKRRPTICGSWTVDCWNRRWPRPRRCGDRSCFWFKIHKYSNTKVNVYIICISWCVRQDCERNVYPLRSVNVYILKTNIWLCLMHAII